MKRTMMLGLAASLLAAVPAGAVTIDFSGYAPGTVIDGELTIGGATFSSTGGSLLIESYSFGNGICAYNGFSCGETLVLSFADGATGLSIDYAGDTVAGSSILFQGESDVLAFVGRSLPDGDPDTVGNISIRFEGVRLLGLSPSDARIGFGNISYAGPVPEPATWGLLIAGFGTVGGALRRRPAARALRA